jgi:hypothetical protein
VPLICPTAQVKFCRERDRHPNHIESAHETDVLTHAICMVNSLPKRDDIRKIELICPRHGLTPSPLAWREKVSMLCIGYGEGKLGGGSLADADPSSKRTLSTPRSPQGAMEAGGVFLARLLPKPTHHIS